MTASKKGPKQKRPKPSPKSPGADFPRNKPRPSEAFHAKKEGAKAPRSGRAGPQTPGRPAPAKSTREQAPARKRRGEGHPFFDKLYLDSFSALSDFLRYRPAAVTSVYCKDAMAAKVDALLASHPHLQRQSFTALGEGAEALSAPLYAELDLQPLSEAELAPRLAGRQHDLIVALDHVTDPRNLGAIARSAAFFGVREIIVAKDRQVLLTKASVATSQGAFALTSLVTVVNLGRTLTQLKEAGYWVLGAALEGEGLEAVAGQYDKVVVVLGAEDRGLSHGIKTKCDRLVTIAGASERLDSLNVAVAAGILLRGLFSSKNG